MDEPPRFYNALLTVLVIGGAVGVKAAFLYAAEIVTFFLVTVSVVMAVMYLKSMDDR